MLRFTIAPIALLGLLGAPAFAQSPPSVQEVVKKLGFPADSKQKVLAGEFVQTALPTVDERDLNVGIAFFVKNISPEQLARQVVGTGLVDRTDPQTLAFGEFGEKASAGDLAKLKLTKAQHEAYVQPKDSLNLSHEEIAGLKKAGKAPAAVQSTVHGQLLARHNSYREKGLAGIAPYARGSESYEPAKDIEKANKATRDVGLLPPAFFDLLDDYPKGAPPDLDESFSWSQFNAHDEDTLALTHFFTGTFGGVVMVVQRQFYASTGYNVEQAVTGFLPVKEGTLVIYTNHTSTDQVAGFGGSAKRNIGRKFMAQQLEGSFKRARAAAAK